MTRRTVALVVAAALMSIGLGACSVGGGDGAGSYELTAWFPSAISLYNDSQVRVLGLPAGHVKSIKVVGSQVRVVLSIHNDIPVPANANATIIPLSFIGERYVQVFPAWKKGEPKLKANSVIPLARTSVPVEADEALAALKHLLDSIDPQATSHLVTNLAADLDGQGQNLNDALKGLGTITETLGSKDKQVGNIIDHFDKLTATLATRDATLGRVLDAFATTTDALAQERNAIQGLLSSLSSLSTNAFDLVNEHHEKLDHDLTVVSRTLRLVGDNIDQLDKILAAGPLLVAGPNLDGKAGFAAAYNKSLHAIDLRVLVTPDLTQALTALGLPAQSLCVPVTTTCSFGGLVVPSDAPSVQPLPASFAASAGAINQPSPAARRAQADVNTPVSKPRGGLRGIIHSISSVFG